MGLDRTPNVAPALFEMFRQIPGVVPGQVPGPQLELERPAIRSALLEIGFVRLGQRIEDRRPFLLGLALSIHRSACRAVLVLILDHSVHANAPLE